MGSPYFIKILMGFNSLAPGRNGSNFSSLFFILILQTVILDTFYSARELNS